LRFIRRVVKATEGHGVDVAICGEMGGRSLEALALIGIGIHRLSITPAAIGPIKAMIRSVDHDAVKHKMDELLASPPVNFRNALSIWATDQGIETG
jgi:phosphotransferase system, enzyme I, PtsP